MRMFKTIFVILMFVVAAAPAPKTPQELAVIAKANADAARTCLQEMKLSAVAQRDGNTYQSRCDALFWQGLFWFAYGFPITEADDWIDDGNGKVNAGDDPGLESGDYHYNLGDQFFGQGEVHMILGEWVSARVCFEAALEQFWTGDPLNAYRYYEQAWQDYSDAEDDYDAAAGCYMFWYYGLM